MSCQWDAFNAPQRTCRPRKHTNSTNNGAGQAILGLLCKARAHCAHLPQKWHGLSQPQRRQIPQRVQRTKQSRRPPFHVQKCAIPPNNGAVLNVAEIIKNIMSSTLEAELSTMYVNVRKAVEIWMILQEMGHPQPPTPIQTDNSTAGGIINARVQLKHTKAMYMLFHWLHNCSANQKQFRFYWRPVLLNFADYWTKHHPPSHHGNMRSKFLTPFTKLLELCRTKTNEGSTARVC